AVLGNLVETYGAHALTMDHLGGVIGQFLEGNPFRAPEVANLADPARDRQALRLARLLKAYEEHSPAEELGLLCRLCLFRRSATEEQLAQFFMCTPAVHARTVREIQDFIERYPDLEEHYPHSVVGAMFRKVAADLAESVRDALDEALCAGPIAGPEQVFRAEIHTIVEKVVELGSLEFDFGELARLYADPALEHPTDALPLKAKDRQTLRAFYARYASLGE